ncbi:MAG: AzlC family ABC transporter permease [Candidatus Hodarchaeales archaeon]
MFFEKSSAWIGLKKFLPISPSIVLFGVILGFTGALGELPFPLVISSSFIIFAGSAQFIVLLLIIKGDPLFAIFLAGVIINLRHLLYGAALHTDITSKGFKRLLLAYLLTDEAFLITSMIKNELSSESNSDSTIILEDVLFGAGFSLWLVWNLSTAIGYFLTDFFSIYISNLPSPEFIVASTFLGYFILHWQESPSDHTFIFIMILMSIFFGFFFQSSDLLIIILIIGVLFAMIREYSSTKTSVNNFTIDYENIEGN